MSFFRDIRRRKVDIKITLTEQLIAEIEAIAVAEKREPNEMMNEMLEYCVYKYNNHSNRPKGDKNVPKKKIKRARDTSGAATTPASGGGGDYKNNEDCHLSHLKNNNIVDDSGRLPFAK
jgi:hypothetical protein